jgi:hypothetical protein
LFSSFEVTPIKTAIEKEPPSQPQSQSPETINFDLSQQLYFRLNFFVSPSEEYVFAISTGFLPYEMALTKEQ